MKVYQSCFSPTGGTKRAADLLCRAWGVRPEPIDLMKHVGPLFFSEDDLCLIAVPVYGGRVPQAALRGLRVMKGNGIPTVLMAVYGNRAVDDALLELRDETRACGFRCIAALEAAAQHSLFPRFGEKRPDREDARELMKYGCQILENGNRAMTASRKKSPGTVPSSLITACRCTPRPPAAASAAACARANARCRPSRAMSRTNWTSANASPACTAWKSAPAKRACWAD